MCTVGGRRMVCAESSCGIVADVHVFVRWTPDGLMHEAEALISPQVATTQR